MPFSTALISSLTRPATPASRRLGRLPGDALVQALVTEYAPGAPIGWHRDRPVFKDVIGVSFLSPCDLRLRRKAGESAGWEVRTGCEHSIPPAPTLRYSVTLRSLRAPG